MRYKVFSKVKKVNVYLNYRVIMMRNIDDNLDKTKTK